MLVKTIGFYPIVQAIADNTVFNDYVIIGTQTRTKVIRDTESVFDDLSARFIKYGVLIGTGTNLGCAGADWHLKRSPVNGDLMFLPTNTFQWQIITPAVSIARTIVVICTISGLIGGVD